MKPPDPSQPLAKLLARLEKRPPRPTESPSNDNDEARLFREAMAELEGPEGMLKRKFDARESRKIEKARAQETARKEEQFAAALAARERDSEAERFARHMESLQVDPAKMERHKEDPDDAALANLVPRKVNVGRKVRKGKFSSEASLDLHGMRTDEAMEAIRRFVIDTQRERLKVVKLITGKGLHSDSGESILRAQALAWLAGRGRQYVWDFHHPPPEDGGGGAIYLFLRSLDDAGKEEPVMLAGKVAQPQGGNQTNGSQE